MQCREILESAIRMLAESDSNGNSSDYTERAPYLLSVFCSKLLSLDSRYRKTNGTDPVKNTLPSRIDLEDPFPLSDVFIPAAIDYLASLLILEENEEISERLYEDYEDCITGIRAELFALGRIRNRYPLA